MADLTALTIAGIREGLAKRDFSALELTEAYLKAIEAANPLLNAYIVTTPEQARDMAKASDARIARGEARALEGVPLGIKDLFCTMGVHSQAGSHILDGFRPRYESTVTQNLWDDGAVMLGKLNMDEFAMGSSNETSFYGPVTNPWRRRGGNADLVPGGSSGGSAAAVAANLCAGATATDTGGSIRQPAAFTGTVGIKPTYGRCSRWGIVAFASSLDQAGPIARNVRDAAILLKSMASVDPKDTTSADVEVPDYETSVGESVRGLKIGVPREYRMDGMPEEIEILWQQGIAWYREAGAEIVDISLPHTKYALPAYYIVAPAEASSNLARYDGVRYGLRVDGDDSDRHVRADPRGRLRARGEAAGADRHLRALRRLLRRLLPARAKSADADQARFRRSLFGRHRRDPDAGDAVRRLRHRREGQRPDRDVPERHFCGVGEHGGAAGDRRAGRARCLRPAAGAAADRKTLRRGDLVPGRPSDRGCRRAVYSAPLVVIEANLL